MGQAVEERGRHLGVAEHRRPFAEGEVRGDDDRGALVKPADQMEQELTSGLGERQIAEFVEDDEVQPRQVIGDPSLLAATRLRLKAIDEIDNVEEPAACAVADKGAGNGDGQMALAGAGAADQDDIALVGDKSAGRKVFDKDSLTGYS